ncbi:hypothetical protein [Gelidibacter maritimus]|uniref:Uncharacterized protein n=1 Tax=Gelidibacter maritimus TaxID=2761487 RepID=A0A7W2M3M3_9FLAO|nr:hypothetical protein [Gelidibacter maritimus]MBA6152090.1 hypothetical protein [Gelidibacter maritimus]
MLRKLLFFSHFLALLLVLHHILMQWVFDIGFQQSLLFWIKMIVVISGLLIAIRFFKTLKWRQFYFALYPLGVAIFSFGFMFRGILGGILMSTIQYPIIADEVAYQKENITIYTKYTGFFSRCCTYRITASYYKILEKEIGDFRTEGQDRLIVKSLKNTTTQLTVTFEDYLFDETLQELELQDRVLVFDK